MIVFENRDEIDPRMAMLMGVNIKEGDRPFGQFGTGLKYAVACLKRWDCDVQILSGENEFSFGVEEIELRGRKFQTLRMIGRRDAITLGFTTELGAHWLPWMVYRELYCNAMDEPEGRIYRTDQAPAPKAGMTHILVDGGQMLGAHMSRDEFILNKKERKLLHQTGDVEIYEGEGRAIFYRGISVQALEKPSRYTYNILKRMYITEDRTAGSWSTDPIIAQALATIEDVAVAETTIAAPTGAMESRLDYSLVGSPGAVWSGAAERLTLAAPLSVPRTVRSKFLKMETKICPTCGQPTHEEEIPF